jgi:hypothetical protein
MATEPKVHGWGPTIPSLACQWIAVEAPLVPPKGKKRDAGRTKGKEEKGK